MTSGRKRGGKQPKPPKLVAGKGVKNSWTSPDQIKHAEKTAEALEFRRQSYSYSAMARAMGITPSYAHKLVVEGILAIVGEPARQLVVLESERQGKIFCGTGNNLCSKRQ